MASQSECALIQEAICDVFKVTREALLSNSRIRFIAEARFASMKLTRDLLKASYPQIGEWHNRHYSDVIHAVKRAKALIDVDLRFEKKFNDANWNAKIALKIP